MRTVTFSNPEVARLVNDTFVAAWSNRIADFHDCQPWTEQRIFQNSTECYSTRNICTFFITQDRRVLHYAPGYMSPTFFLDELKFAQELGRRTLEDGLLRDDRAASFRIMHEQRARLRSTHVTLVQQGRWKLSRPKSKAFGASNGRSLDPCRAASLIEGLETLKLIHQDFAKAAEAKRLPELKDLLSKHRSGNEFAEEVGVRRAR
jgi:hypothetical protein